MQEAIFLPQTLAEGGKIGLSLSQIGINVVLVCQVVGDSFVHLFQSEGWEAVNRCSRGIGH